MCFKHSTQACDEKRYVSRLMLDISVEISEMKYYGRVFAWEEMAHYTRRPVALQWFVRLCLRDAVISKQ